MEKFEHLKEDWAVILEKIDEEFTNFQESIKRLEGTLPQGKNLAQLQRRQQSLPIGNLQGSMTDFRFRLNQEHPLLNGLSITELNLSEVSYAISMQQQLIEISQLTLNGDLEGSVTGNIRLNERNPLESRIDLDLKVRLSQKLQDQLGPLTMMLQGFRCGDFFDVKIRGTFRQISPPFRNRCT